MFIVQSIIVGDEIIEKQFKCNLTACKGACCFEGDFGAPLEKEELSILEAIWPDVKPYLTEEGKKAIEEQGLYTYYEDNESYGTPLIEKGPCAYIQYDANHIAHCGIEIAYRNGSTTFRKPISCHLYPIRISKNEHTGFEAMNYEKWHICSPACTLGKKENIFVYQFLKEAIIRKYGAEFYEELDQLAENYMGRAEK